MTRGAFDTEIEPGSLPSDGVVAKYSMLPLGVDRFGNSTPGPAGPLAAGVLAMPQLGSATFGLTCTNGPMSTAGLLAVSTGRLAAPITVKGTDFWLDPAELIALVPVASNSKGYSELPALLPAHPALEGVSTYVQYFWPGTGAHGVAASNALAISLQP